MRNTLSVLLVGLAAGCTGAREQSPQHDHRDHGHDASSASPSPASSSQPELRKIAPSAGYPLKTCVVSGDRLDAMGEPSAYSYGGTEVQFCCPDCVDEFKKDPDKYLERIRAAK